MTLSAAVEAELPEAPHEVPPLDRTGRTYLMVEIGPSARPICDRWVAQAAAAGSPFQRWSCARADATVQAALVQRLATLCVGARLMVVGPAADVLSIAAWARANGVLPEEVEVATVWVAQPDLNIFCVHCATTSRLPGAPGLETTCPSCGRRLQVHDHVSTHRGSYLASAPTPVSEQA